MNRKAKSGLEGLISDGNHKPFEVTWTREDYAKVDITSGFDWPEIMNLARDLRGIRYGDELYLVVFRSRIKSDITGELYEELLRADEAALEEAKAANEDGEPSGLLCYFAGEPDSEGNCLSFCFWTSREAALARMGPQHKVAMEYADRVYEEFSFERHLLLQPSPDSRVLFAEYYPQVPINPN